MTCDICNAEGRGAAVSAKQMRAAVDGGFNPFELGVAAGTGHPGKDFAWWKSMLVGQDATDWWLCDRCREAIEPYLSGAAAAAAPRPGTLPTALEAAMARLAAEPAKEDADGVEPEPAQPADAEPEATPVRESSGKKCSRCGRERLSGARYCVECGKAFRSGWKIAAVSGSLAAAAAIVVSIWVFSSPMRRTCISAKFGNAESQYALGAAYKRGTNVEQDYAQAAEWFRSAADVGFAPAQFEYGVLRFHGLGVVEDQEEGWRYLERAADAGIPEAQFFLGSLLLNDLRRNVSDAAGAEQWIRRAAEAGYTPAEYCLANEYISGRVFSRNYAAADVLLRDLIARGFLEAEDVESYLWRNLMTADERAEADRLWIKSQEQP